MDGLIPLLFKALRKKKAMKYYRSLSSCPARPDVAELTRQDLFMTPQHQKAVPWYDPEPTSMAVRPRRERPRGGGGGGMQPLAAMEALPREAFSPRKRAAPTAMDRLPGASTNLGGST